MELNHANPSQIRMLVPFAADHVRAQSVLDVFISMLRHMADAKDTPISHLLSEQVLPTSIASVNTVAPCQTPALALTAFEGVVAATPTKIAIRTNAGKEMSYAEFNSKANNFAAWLLDQGVHHEEMIPLYMEKSIETLISIFGIIKSGASFTPLDPKNPHDRNAFVIKDVNAKRVVTDVKNSDACRAFGVDLIVTETMDLDEVNAQNPEIPELKTDSVIYAIYTSGSTGLPKGVLVQHSAVVASTEGMIEATHVTSEWNALWVLNYVFDASYYDVFTIFSAGGTLSVAPQEELLYDLSGHINRMDVEQVMLTPTITKLIGGPEQVPNLKVLNVCGERIDADILRWADSVDVYNGYGPTEATILMTVSKVEPGSSLDSIGYPLKHAHAVIVPSEGKNLDPVANGEVGELCIYGPHLAKGYLNRPEQTAAAFVRDENGTPFYRTGDLARWAANGSLECLGRKDHQIKLNGFRVELGEIENAIVTTGYVTAVVVSLVEVSGKKQLCAFCIFKGDHSAREQKLLPPHDRVDTIPQLISKLTTISHYMIPALFLPFTSFPTLPSGKADRKRLVALVENMDRAQVAQYTSMSEDAVGFVPVNTDEEKIMQEAWSSVLGEDESDIGASSVFLSLGGDSISAINVVSACRKMCYEISVSQILSSPTLAEQAKHLQPVQAKQNKMEVVLEIPKEVHSALQAAGIAATEIEEIYPCGPGQTEFLIQGHKEQQFWNLHAIRELSPDFDLEHWTETAKKLTARNQIMRASYIKADVENDSSWYQVILKDPILDYEEYTYSTDEEKLQYILDLRDSLFALGTPNIRYRVLHSSSGSMRTLCIKVDHGSYDGTLLRIFDEQFKAIARGGPDLPPINSFKNFIDWSATVDIKPALKYWKNSLESYEPQHCLPRQPVTDSLLMAPVTAAVDVIATRYGVTASTVFQAAYSLVVARLSGSQDILVDNLLTGRNVDLQDPNTLNGTCANFLPFRSVISGPMPTQDFLRKTQATFWDTAAAGTVGLTSIYEALGQDRQVYGAKVLYCFQPFEPAPAGATDVMRWIVMAQSKVLMTINYALMVEVQKTLKGYRLKVQWDSRAINRTQVDEMVELFNKILNTMSQSHKDSSKLIELLDIETGIDAIWSESQKE
nr:nonribosomal peptide synthetase 7 [Quercus suber]